MGLNNIGCDLIRGIELPACNSGGFFGRGGIQQLFLVKANWVDPNGYTYDSNDMITGITMFSNQKFKEIQLQFETGTVNEKEVYDSRSGSIQFQSTINFLVYKEMSLNRKLLLELINAQQLLALYQDNNNRWFLAGKDNFLRAEINSMSTGKMFSDFNGYNVSLFGFEKWSIFEVIADIIAFLTESNSTEDCCFFRDNKLSLIQNYKLFDYKLCNVSIC